MRFLLALAVTVTVCASAPQSSGQLDFLILDQDANANSGPVINSALNGLGFVGHYTLDLDPYLDNLTNYCSIWICLGMFPSSRYPWGDHPDWDDSLVSHLVNHGGSIYMEGGECWLNDPPFNLRGCFGIEGYFCGTAFLSPILGVPGTFLEGLSCRLSGDNAFVDGTSPIPPAYAVLVDSAQSCTCGVANESGAYVTLGVSFEFGGLADGGACNKEQLAEAIMSFFGCSYATPDYDLIALQVVSPDWYAVPDSATTPEVRFRNVGLNDADSVDAYVAISPGGYLSHRVISILSGQELIQAFDPWVPGPQGTQYMLCAYHSWGLDERPGNDTICSNVTSWDGRWEVHSAWTSNGSAVAIDGVIDYSASEWEDATVRDVSDFLGRSGSAEPPGSAYLYVMNDSLNVYIALDAVADPSRTNADFWSLYFEDSFDKSWPSWPDSSEGRTSIFVNMLSMHSYLPIFSDHPSLEYAVYLDAVCGDESGHMQYEYVVPLDDDPARGDSIHPNLLADPGDTVGFWMMALDQEVAEVYAWWPTSSEFTGHVEPDYIGCIVLNADPVGSSECASGSTSHTFFLGQNLPNPLSISAAIQYSLPASAKVTLAIYDITGRLVETLVNEVQQPGIHQVRWDREDSPSGVYFYRLKAGEFVEARKMVVID